MRRVTTNAIPRPRAILFDLFHTLVVIPRLSEHGAPTHEELGIEKDTWDHHFFHDAAGRGVGRVRDPVEALRTIAHACDPSIPMEKIRAASATRCRRFEHAFVSPEDAIVDALRRVRSAGIRTAVVSDCSFDEVAAWPRSPLAPLVDHVSLSCEVGVKKPAPEIYEHALRGVDVEARDALFVGDGGSQEHMGARRVGMRTVLVTRLRSLWWDTPHDATHVDWVCDDVPELVRRIGL